MSKTQILFQLLAGSIFVLAVITNLRFYISKANTAKQEDRRAIAAGVIGVCAAIIWRLTQ